MRHVPLGFRILKFFSVNHADIDQVSTSRVDFFYRTRLSNFLAVTIAANKNNVQRNKGKGKLYFNVIN